LGDDSAELAVTERLIFGLLTIVWAARWAFATIFGLRACFDAVAGVRLLI
jgi:hypothetical protein